MSFPFVIKDDSYTFTLLGIFTSKQCIFSYLSKKVPFSYTKVVLYILLFLFKGMEPPINSMLRSLEICCKNFIVGFFSLLIVSSMLKFSLYCSNSSGYLGSCILPYGQLKFSPSTHTSA